MNALEKKLWTHEVGDIEPDLCIRTGTGIDAGRWWRKTPVWLCIVGDELILLAVARRRYVQRIAIADCLTSHYSNATGELMIAPCETLLYNRFALSPREALNVLSFLKIDHKTNRQTLTPQP
jgi:hypothetical protein